MVTTSEQDWKKKYFQALEQQESQEKSFRTRLGLMKKGLLRVSLAADGVDSRLDKHLEELRTTLRSDRGGGRLGVIINQLEETVLQLDNKKQRQAHGLNVAFEQMVEQLIEHEPPGSVKRELKRFSKDAKQRSKNAYEYPSLIIDYARLMKSALVNDEQKVSHPGIFRRLFSTGKGDVKTPSTSEVNISPEPGSGRVNPEIRTRPAVVQEDIVPSPVRKTSTPSREPEAEEQASVPDMNTGYVESLSPTEIHEEKVVSEADAIEGTSSIDHAYHERTRTAISSSLAELLGQIEVQEDVIERREEIRTRLLEGLDWPGVVPAIDNIRSIMCMAFDADREAFEEFLQSLDQRLVDVSGHLMLVVDSEKSETGAELNESMREQVNRIRTTVDEATELDHLKQSVSEHVENITQAMDKFQEESQQREQSVLEQLDAMAAKVTDMELDSRQARKKLEDQQQRLMEDTLTRLPNRSAYNEILEREYQRWKRFQRPLCLVVGDMDLFKQVNDKYGHLAGDMVLQGISKILGSRLRSTDFVARYGGEEFVFLLPETNVGQALITINSVREEISKLEFYFGQSQEKVEVSMSFGIAGFCKGDTSESVFERADMAMYQAKEEGRDRCVIAPDREEVSEES